MNTVLNGAGGLFTVVGAEESGLAAMALLRHQGARVRCSVSGQLSSRARAALQEWGIACEEGGHRAEFFEGSLAVIVSPGVKPSSSAIALARAAKVPVWSEIELAARLTRGPWAAVTGSNGKSTTATLLWEMWRRQRPCDLCGNIGRAFARSVFEDPDSARVVEVSSFQLYSADEAHPKLALILNLSPNHLDWHPDLEDYYASKFRVARNMTPEDAVVLNADDPEVMKRAESLRCRKIYYSLGEWKEGWGVREGRAVRMESARETLSVRLQETRLLGRHNVGNILAAAAGAAFLGVSVEGIEEAIRETRPLANRLEETAEWNGLRFINDSKSTTSLSTAAALRSFDRGVILLCGGKRKQESFRDVLPEIQKRVSLLVLYGECADFLEKEFADFSSKIRVRDLGEAVDAALAGARPGQTVLLSPMCSSFDQYRSYEERGAHFRRLVQEKTAFKAVR